METKRGWDRLPERQAIEPEGRQRVRDAPGGAHRVFSYIERGLYARQIEHFLTLFPRHQGPLPTVLLRAAISDRSMTSD